MIKTAFFTTFTLILISCSQSSKKVEAQQTQQEPPLMKQESSYLKIDSNLLASDKDPVCGMKIKNEIVDTATYNHKLYGFCGTGCKDAFLQEPLSYLTSMESHAK